MRRPQLAAGIATARRRPVEFHRPTQPRELSARREPLRDILSSYAWAVSPRCEPVFVIVSGPPASGKSTLAPQVALALGLPLIAKDTIKDALMSVLDVPDVAASRHLGRASVRAMLAVAAQSPIGAVIESNFFRSVTGSELDGLPGRVIEVFCRCGPDTAWDRYRSRAGTRHAGHFDHDRTRDELWNDEVAEPVAGGWPLLEVDTNTPVDITAVVQFVDTHRQPPDGVGS